MTAAHKPQQPARPAGDETMADTTSVRVVRYTDGRTAGRVEIDPAAWGQYAACQHPSYQWPEGLALAGDVLTGEQVEALGLRDGETIYLEE